MVHHVTCTGQWTGGDPQPMDNTAAIFKHRGSGAVSQDCLHWRYQRQHSQWANSSYNHHLPSCTEPARSAAGQWCSAKQLCSKLGLQLHCAAAQQRPR
jgi:hypothetical protein